MKRKFFLAMTMLAITGALLLTSQAQTQINHDKLMGKVTLKCRLTGGSPVPNTYLSISNPTMQNIPPVSTIYITTSTKDATSPVSKTSNPLALTTSGNWVDVYNPLKGLPASQCEAWTFVK